MPVSIYEGEKTVTGGDGIEVTSNKVINLILRELNNLIKINGNNEVYVDLQLDDNLQSTSTIPVGVNVGRVLQANGFPVTGTLITAKTTSGDVVKVLYGDDGEIRVDNGTGTWKNITTAYFKTQAEYDALPAGKTSDGNLYIIVDHHNDFLSWEDLEEMGNVDATSYLNQRPDECAEYYESTGDVEKVDRAEEEEVTLPSGKYMYMYRGHYYDEIEGLNYNASKYDTNLTWEDFQEYFVQWPYELYVFASSGLWGMNRGGK